MTLDDIDFLIIGATKSATTWLQRSLQVDPAISMPDPELHYFSREFVRGDAWYLSQFPPNASRFVAGEKSNSYLEKAEAAARIARKLPAAKLVVQLRNPVDRAYSDYCMLYRRGEVGSDVASYLDPRKSQYTRLISAGFYHRQLQAYYDFFPSNQILVTFFEAVKTRPVEQLVTVRHFLGLPGEIGCETVPEKVKDRTTPMLNPGLRRVLRPLKPVVAPFRSSRYFRAVHGMLAREIRYAPLPNTLRQRLVDHYARDVEALGNLLGRDLSHWLLDSSASR